MIADAAYTEFDGVYSVAGQLSGFMQNRAGLTDAEIVKSAPEPLLTSVFSSNATNPCLFAVRAKLRQLTGLPVGWDGYDGKPVDPDIASFAFHWLSAALPPRCPAPQIVPLGYGGVQFEWHERGVDLEIEVEAPNKVYASFEDHQTGQEAEGHYSTDYALVESLLVLLSDRGR